MVEKRRVDLVLVNPGNRKEIYQDLGSALSAVEPPIWAGLIATFIRNAGCHVMILDADAEGIGPAETAGRIADINPHLSVVAVYGHNPSASTMIMPAARTLCEEIKKVSPSQKLLLVGGHVAALPERTLHEEAADFVCDGEGPYTILELLRALKSERSDFDQVHGLVYRDGGRTVHTQSAPLVMDLDGEMPGVAWDLLPMDRYRAHNWHCFDNVDEREPYAALYTSLGCPFHCDFCCIQAPFKGGERALGYPEKKNTYRRWSPESVIAQIDHLVTNYRVKNFKFADELFVLHKDHVHGICDLIVERGYDLNIWAYARVDSCDAEMLDRMKKAGINWLCLGIESANARVCNDVNKGLNRKDLARSVEMIREAGIHIIANYLFGLPEDDAESMQQTLDLALELNCEFSNFYCAMAYPGSRLYERALEANLPLPSSWCGYSQHGFDTLPLPTKYLDAPEVLRFRDRAFQEYFTNPRYLDMMEGTFGPPAVRHIKEMASHKLERKYAS